MPSRTLPLLFAAVLIAACSDQSDTASQYRNPTAAEWARFTQMHIVFGHQSVGANLIAGVRILAKEQQIDLTIADSALDERDVVIHQFPIGANGNPISKIDAFRSALQQGAGTHADIAQMKFCFIDFTADIDPQALAATYIKQTAELSSQYPNTIFIATTSPLTTIQTGPKAWLKRLLGKYPAGYRENLRRYEFNQILRAHYGNNLNGNSTTLFDLAALESLRGNTTFSVDNKTVEALSPFLSSDGGHLNEQGQRLVAAAWIQQLSSLKLPAHDNNTQTTQP